MAKDIFLYRDASGAPVEVPVLHHRSRRAGPHILLSCLVHGDEIVGLHAALSVFEFAKRSRSFRGSLSVLTCLNRRGFEQSSRMFQAEFLNGSSGSQNLNRCFGTEAQNLTNQVARTILKEVKSRKPDLVIDCHSYASNSLVHIIVDRPGGSMERSLLELCSASRVPFYLEYASKIQKAQKLDFSFSNQLCLAGIPALTVEFGPLKGFSQAQGVLATTALRNLLIAKGALAGEVKDLFTVQHAAIPPKKTFFRAPIVNDSSFSGFYRPKVDVGAPLARGQVIAEIVNLKGRVVHSVKAKDPGYLLVLEDCAYVYPNVQFGVMIRS